MQATAPATQAFGAETFAPSATTTLRWLGMAGWLLNSRGTTVMIDPLLEGFDTPLLIHMLANGEATVEDMGWELFRLILEVAGGNKKVATDALGIYNDLALFNPGPLT